ncbi:MAG: ATP-binding protein [Treponema sp.]|jgi:hypothetical protein|nr:ATP-binding protein [Treponema sp.]
MHFSLVDLVADITQNAIEADADLVELEVINTENEFRFLVKDNGKGMTEEEIKEAVDPFNTDGVKHPNRRVGLGLPFLTQTAVVSNGGWEIKSEKGTGTTVSGWFDTGNVDTPPVGDLPGIFRTILMFNSPGEIIIHRRKSINGNEDEYKIIRSEIKDAVGSLEDAGSLVLLGEYLRSLEEE